ncbi:hypothetical protein HOY82DRAFT_614067 [Tuber indicum]|nr:hypothetical protein HOY82DRAFT_614067 [Tuber indicum]
MAKLPVTKSERVAQKVQKKEVAESVARVAPRKEVPGKVAIKVAKVVPEKGAVEGKRLVSEDEGEGDRRETGWRVITRKNKKRLVKEERTPVRVGFVFRHVDGCANNTLERNDFLQGVLDRMKAKKTHRGVVKMLLEGKGCLNCSFGKDEDERIWIPEGGD